MYKYIYMGIIMIIYIHYELGEDEDTCITIIPVWFPWSSINKDNKNRSFLRRKTESLHRLKTQVSMEPQKKILYIINQLID